MTLDHQGDASIPALRHLCETLPLPGIADDELQQDRLWGRLDR